MLSFIIAELGLYHAGLKFIENGYGRLEQIPNELKIPGDEGCLGTSDPQKEELSLQRWKTHLGLEDRDGLQLKDAQSWFLSSLLRNHECEIELKNRIQRS